MVGLGVICVAMFISAMDMTIVNVALPDMSNDLDAGIGELQWVLDAFLVSLAGLLLVGNGLADRFGRRRVFLLGLVGFAVTSVLAAASQTVGELIAARALMGVAAACVMPPALSLLAVLFPPELRAKAAGDLGGGRGVGLALGPVVGGVLVDVAGWRWVFLVNVPFVLRRRSARAALAAGVAPAGGAAARPPRRGALQRGAGRGSCSRSSRASTPDGRARPCSRPRWWAWPPVVAFFAIELRRRRPAVRRARARTTRASRRARWRSSTATSRRSGCCSCFPSTCSTSRTDRRSLSGAVIAPFGLVLGVTAAVSGRLVTRHGPRVVLLAGLLTAACGFVPLLLLSGDSSPALVLLGTAIVGGGIGLVGPSATTVIMNDLGLEKAGDGAAVNQLARQVGGALGVAIVGSVFAAVYAAQVTQGGGVPAAAKESIEDATDVANRLHGAARVDLLDDAIASLRRGGPLGARGVHGRPAPGCGRRRDRAFQARRRRRARPLYGSTMSEDPGKRDVTARARAWRHGAHAAVCDVLEPWAHGTVARATRYESYWDLNVVRVEDDDPAMTVEELIAFSDRALAGLAHRRIDFEDIGAGERVRADFEARGWQTLRLVYMRHEVPPPPGPQIAVEQVPYDAVDGLRVAWHHEDFPGQDPTSYIAQAREVAMRRDVQILAVREGGEPIAFAVVERAGPAAEITAVYVRPDHRGGGRGTALTRAAIEATRDVEDLWISADDEDRPKDLYARLGFRPAWTAIELTRLP